MTSFRQVKCFTHATCKALHSICQRSNPMLTNIGFSWNLCSMCEFMLVLKCYLFRVSCEWILVCSWAQCLQSSTMNIIFQMSKLHVVLNINSCLTSWNRTFGFCECLQLDKKNPLLPWWQVCSLCKFYTNKQMNKNRWWSFLSTIAVFIHDDNLYYTINFMFTIKLHPCGALHHP